MILSHETVSSRHALLSWRDGIWQLQDLHSRNGTYVNGTPLAVGGLVGLEQGAELSFGTQAETYVLLDASEPRTHAVLLSDRSQVVEIDGGMLALPPEGPEVMILWKDKHWQMERAKGVEQVRNAQIVSTRAGDYLVCLTEELLPTENAADAALTVSSLQLQLQQCSNSTVEASMRRGAQRLELGVRTYHAPMIALAHVRLESREGWIEQDALLHRLGYLPNRLHVEIHRCRRQLARAGVVDAVRLIERRASKRQLRLGVSNIEFIDMR